MEIIFVQKIGEDRGFNISGAVSTTSDRISVITATFQRFHQDKPIDFELRFDRPKTEKLEIRNRLTIAGTEVVMVSVNIEGDNDEGKDKSWSSLVVGDEGCLGPSRKLLCLC